MPKVLIVEDNRLNRDTLKGLLNRLLQSMIVEEASNGGEAMEKVESFQPDLILMDIRLPDTTGLELTKRIKINSPKTKVLILTGHHYPEYKEMAIRYGADGFLVKGGSGQEILAMVESFFPQAEEVISTEK